MLSWTMPNSLLRLQLSSTGPGIAPQGIRKEVGRSSKAITDYSDGASEVLPVAYPVDVLHLALWRVMVKAC